MNTVRFTRVVGASGEPEPYTLWTAPDKDQHFQAALRAHRVMTVHQNNVGTSADVGVVGFREGDQASFLVFPKSLKQFEGRRVVGIKYDLLRKTPPTTVPRSRSKDEKPKRKTRSASAPKFEQLRVFEPPEPEKRAGKRAAVSQLEGRKEGDAAQRLKALTGEVRKAVKKLEQGNAVAAFRILEKSLSPLERPRERVHLTKRPSQ